MQDGDKLYPVQLTFWSVSHTVWIIEKPFTMSTPTPCNAIVTLLKCASSCHEIQSVNISSKSLSPLDKHLAFALLSALYICEDEIIVRVSTTCKYQNNSFQAKGKVILVWVHLWVQYFVLHTSSKKFQKLSYDAFLSTDRVLHSCFNFLFFCSLSSEAVVSTLFCWGEFSRNFIVYNEVNTLLPLHYLYVWAFYTTNLNLKNISELYLHYQLSQSCFVLQAQHMIEQ